MRILTILLIVSVVFVLGCSGSKPGNGAKTGNAEVKKGVAPVADAEIAVIEMETPAYGTIKLELYSNIAPKMVARFKELAKEGYYDGIAFHRINDKVIQAGDADTKSGRTKNPTKEGDSGKPDVPAEFSDIPFDTGFLGAARLGGNVNSQNSQFFIMLQRESGFDTQYTVYGKVVEGMSNVRTISSVTPKEGERPIEPVRIKSIKIVSK